nr:NTP transferase domain-containing protein [uncultured Neokomagataea sp.]
MSTLPVLVLAGSREGAHDPLARLGKVSHKALLPVGGQPMLCRVLDALISTQILGPITVSIEQPDLITPLLEHYTDHTDTITTHQARTSLNESVADALKTIGTPCLVTTADHALLQPDWIVEFLTQTQNADVAVGIALRHTIERDVPGTKRTYIRLSDITFSGCNLFWLGSPKAHNVITLWKRLQQDRKKPLRMARTLGLGILLRALFRRLDTATLCKRIEALTGARIRFIPLSDGRAAVDVDKPEDLTLVEKILATHSPAP